MPDRNPVQDIHHTPLVIIGGGISGIAAAWYAQARGIPYTLIEASAQWGGKIRTELVDSGVPDAPYIIEVGPDSVISQKPWARQLATAAGLADDIIGTNDDQRKTYIYNRGRLMTLPDGVLLIVPTKIMPFALSPLFSPLGKLRMGLDLFIPPKRDDDDESLAEFVRRRLGQEALDKLAEPLMSGIYNTDAEAQSLLATFPRFREIERQHGSLTRGMLASQAQRITAAATRGNNADKPKQSMFTSFKGGMQSLVDGIMPQLTGDLRLNTRVDHIEPLPDGGYALSLSDGTHIETQAVIMTTPAYAAADLLREMSGQAAQILDAISYVATGTMSLVFRQADVAHVPEGFGVVIPRSAKRQINAITFSSTKFDYRAPAGDVLYRVFYGGTRSPQTMRLDDDALYQTVRAELRDILNITAEPVLHRIYRWQKATPQYDVGHLDRMATLEAALPPHIYLTGSAYRGIGVPDCVHEAQLTIERAADQLPEQVDYATLEV